jgi:predicted NodU family carbamoyl transferase
MAAKRNQERVTSMGVGYSEMHDSSAHLLRDRQPLFAVAEGRISHDARFRQLAIPACLDFAKIRPEQIDEVCFVWQLSRHLYARHLKLYLQKKLRMASAGVRKTPASELVLGSFLVEK